jgi:hypothetical protein
MTAQQLHSDKVVTGYSEKLSPDQQAKLTGDAWEHLPEPKPRLSLELVDRNGTTIQYCLGPHTPTLRPEDVQLMHAIWLDLTKDLEFSGLHHYHVVALALRELQLQLRTGERDELLQELSHDILGITKHASNGNGMPVTHEKRL